jgi:hypothetical protein
MSAVLWDVMSCSAIQVCSRFWGGYCLHLQGRRVKQSSCMTLLFNTGTLTEHTALRQIPENIALHVLLSSEIILSLPWMCYKKHWVIWDIIFQSSYFLSCIKGIIESWYHASWLETDIKKFNIPVIFIYISLYISICSDHRHAEKLSYIPLYIPLCTAASKTENQHHKMYMPTN